MTYLCTWPACKTAGCIDCNEAVELQDDDEREEDYADGRVTESEFEAFDQQTHEAMSAIADLRDRLRGMVVPESTLRRVR